MPPLGICVLQRDAGARAAEASGEGDGAVVSAALRALGPNERAGLHAALVDSTSRWEARLNPFVDDVEGSNPDTSLEDWLRHAPPAVSTARAAARTEVCASDGLCVRPVLGRGVTCPRGWSTPEGVALTERARFLVWWCGHAVWMAAPSAAAAEETATRLRAAATQSRLIGLVLAPDDARTTEAPPFNELRRLWIRRAVLRRLAQAGEAALGRDGGHGAEGHASEDPAPPSVLLAPDELLVMPRLAAVGHDAELQAELAALAPSATRLALP